MIGEVTCGIECVGGEVALRTKVFGVSDTGGDALVRWTRGTAGHSCENKISDEEGKQTGRKHPRMTICVGENSEMTKGLTIVRMSTPE